MQRRSFLEASVMTAALLTVSGCQTMPEGDSEDDTGHETEGETPENQSGADENRTGQFERPTTVAIDYDQYDYPTDVYYMWDVRTATPPTFEPSPTNDRRVAFAHHLDGAQKTANTQYQFANNGFRGPEEAYSRIRVHPNDLTLEESGTLRFYWAGVHGGPRSSGGDGAPTGDDGWSIALSMAHRDDHEHPDGYNFSVYTYHMDQPTNSGESERSGHQLWTDQWNEIECYQKLNTYQDGEANHDGVFRAWVNGELAYEREDFRWVTEPEQGIERVGPVVYHIGPEDLEHTLYYVDHELTVSERTAFERHPDTDDDPNYVAPERMDEFDGQLTYHNGNDEARYRLYVDGEIVQSSWNHITYNENVAFDDSNGIVAVDATTAPNTVDGYFYSGSVVAIGGGANAGTLWASGTLLDPDAFPDEPETTSVNLPRRDE